MSLRTRLVRAFFLLAVVPLVGITLSSYLTTRRAYRKAVEAEAAAAAGELNARLDATTRDLGRRFERLGELPFGTLWAGKPDAGAADKLVADVRQHIGDVAPLVRSLEFIPTRPAPPGPPPHRTGVVPPVAPAPAVPEPRAFVIAPEPPPPAEGPEPPEAPRWSWKYKAIAAAAAAMGEELAREAKAVESEVSRQRAEAERQQQQAEQSARGERQAADREARAAEHRQRQQAQHAEGAAREQQHAAEQAQREAGYEAEAQQRREELARKALQVAQLSLSADRDQKPEAGRVVAETAALAMRHLGETIAHEARIRYAPRAGYSFDYTLRRDGAAVGTVRAQVDPQEVLAGVFSRTRRDRSEIPFAVDSEGRLFAAEADRRALGPLRVEAAARGGGAVSGGGEWVVVTKKDAQSGLTLGIARPLGDGLKEIRTAALKNLGYGLGMTGLALVGILPLSRRLTRDLSALTEGATRLAHGESDVSVPVRSRDEVGRLAQAFNKMATDLRTHQERALAQERLHKELEMGRRIQEEMLPHERLQVPFAEAKGLSIPAREVGGDFFNYFPLTDGLTALMIGDVSGKGVGAALLMANLQATLRARMPLESDLTALARHLDYEIDRTTSTTVYLTAFIGVLDGPRRLMRYVNAGHNAPFLLRKDGRIESLEATGRPLGLYPGGDYEERQVELSEGDSLLLYTDGIVESENPAGEPFGNDRLEQLLLRWRELGLDGILSAVEQAVRDHRGGREADDDATLVVLKVGGPARAEPGPAATTTAA